MVRILLLQEYLCKISLKNNKDQPLWCFETHDQEEEQRESVFANF
jgi:hypothetical protein